jgi:hypothetical protein
MRKMKNMLGALAVALAIVLALSCSNPTQSSNKDDGTKPTPTPASGVTLYTGTIENYQGDGDIYAAYINSPITNPVAFRLSDLKRVKIGTVSGGTFSFDLKGIPTAELMSLREHIPAEITLSYAGARGIYAVVYVVKPGEPDGYILHFSHGTDFYSVIYSSGFYTSAFMYVDRALTIKGSGSNEYTSEGGEFTMRGYYNYDLNLKQGWNMYYSAELINEASSTTTVSTTTTSTPFPDCAWYIISAGL